MRRSSRTLLAAVGGAVLACFSATAWPAIGGPRQMVEAAAPNSLGISRHLWFVTAPAVARLHRLDPALTEAMLNRPGTYILGRGTARTQWKGGVRAQYESYADFGQALAQGTVDPAVTAVAYNPEVWKQTPESEQNDPVAYAHMFTTLAHQHRWVSIIAPSCGLLRKMSGVRRGPVFNNCAALLLAPLAPYADILDFEAQSMEHDPALYARRVAEAAMLVKRANPQVKFVAQLSTSLKQNASTDQLLFAARAVASYVDGFWLHVDSGDPDSVAEALAFLHKFRATGE